MKPNNYNFIKFNINVLYWICYWGKKNNEQSTHIFNVYLLIYARIRLSVSYQSKKHKKKLEKPQKESQKQTNKQTHTEIHSQTLSYEQQPQKGIQIN